MLKRLVDSLCSLSCLVLGVGNTLTLQEREFSIGRNVFFPVCDLGRLTGKADWEQFLEGNRPQCSSREPVFCLPLSVVYSKTIEKYEHWKGNFKEAH